MGRDLGSYLGAELGFEFRPLSPATRCLLLPTPSIVSWSVVALQVPSRGFWIYLLLVPGTLCPSSCSHQPPLTVFQSPSDNSLLGNALGLKPRHSPLPPSGWEAG